MINSSSLPGEDGNGVHHRSTGQSVIQASKHLMAQLTEISINNNNNNSLEPSSPLDEQRIWLSQLQAKHRSLANKLENQRHQLTAIHNQLIYYGSSQSKIIERIPSLKESAFTQWEELISLRKDCDEIKIRYTAHEKDDSLNDDSLGSSNIVHPGHHHHGTNDSGELWPPATSSTSSTSSSPSSSSSVSVMIKQEMETASDRAHSSSSTNTGLGIANSTEGDYPIEMTMDKAGSVATTSSEPESGYFPRSNSGDLKDGNSAFLGSSAIWKVPLNNDTDGVTFALNSTGSMETPSDSSYDPSRSPNGLHYSTLESKENGRKWSPSTVTNPPSSNGVAISIFCPKVANYSPVSSFASGKSIRRSFYSPNGWLGSESSESQASSENCFEMVQEGFENCSSASSNNNNALNAGSEAPFSENYNNSSYPYSYISMGSHHLIASSASVIHKSPPYQQSARQSIPYHVNSQLSFMGREFMSSSGMLPDHGSNISN